MIEVGNLFFQHKGFRVWGPWYKGGVIRVGEANEVLPVDVKGDGLVVSWRAGGGGGLGFEFVEEGAQMREEGGVVVD